ncbi:MAG: glycosyltransferase [Candidatus Sericytochromatia bacterium]|nr:glycosyltransferase [Candidatus Sericytochromatia bacterium]
MLSVVVLTSPGREPDLEVCLSMLCQQRFRSFEVIVVDDGSAQGHISAQPFETQLALKYIWSRHRGNLSAQRNLGASESNGRGLVFLDSDILLNPHGLGIYAALIAEKDRRAIGGYIGSHGDFVSPSYWLPEQQVWGVDYRFGFVKARELWVHRDVILHPFRYFWSGNFAIRRSDFERVGGFNPQFKGWGLEDIDLGQRLMQAGIALDFCLDTWAEQRVPAQQKREPRQTQNQIHLSPEPEIAIPAQVIYNPAFSLLGEILHGHHFPKSGRWPALAIPETEQAQWQHITL